MASEQHLIDTNFRQWRVMQKPNAFQFRVCFPCVAKTNIQSSECTFSASPNRVPSKQGYGKSWKCACFGDGHQQTFFRRTRPEARNKTREHVRFVCPDQFPSVIATETGSLGSEVWAQKLGTGSLRPEVWHRTSWAKALNVRNEIDQVGAPMAQRIRHRASLPRARFC